MEKVSALKSWLDRRSSLHEFALLNRVPDREMGGFIGIDVAVPAHKSLELKAESLVASWQADDRYVQEALRIINSEEPLWLDREEVQMIMDELGEPPVVAYPIYFISVGIGVNERLVYVGKTSSSKSRFNGGHPALSKLHAPEYEGLQKTLYMGTLVFLNDHGYLPIEWIKPLDKAEQLLKAVEAQIIFDFKPELNSDHKTRFNSNWPTIINFESYANENKFLDGEQSSGPIGHGKLPYIWSPEEEAAASKKKRG